MYTDIKTNTITYLEYQYFFNILKIIFFKERKKVTIISKILYKQKENEKEKKIHKSTI